MGWLRGNERYDRRRILRQAARAARSRRASRRRKAIALYGRVLAVEPNDADVLRKVAPLLVQTGEPAQGRDTYRRAAAIFVERGFVDRAVGVYRDAVRRLPREASIWKEMAELEAKRGRTADAIATLLDGRRRFRRRGERQQAIDLLAAARRIDRTNLEVTLDLAALLERCGARARGLALLEGILAVHPSCAARIRRRQLAISPTPAALWRWLRAVLGRERPARSLARRSLPRARARG